MSHRSKSSNGEVIVDSPRPSKKQKTSNSSKDPSSQSKQISPAKKWCFTFNHYSEEHIPFLQERLKDHKYIFKPEIGEENKTPHLQGYVCFKTKKRPLSEIPCSKIHWIKCNGSEQDNIDYICKEETSAGPIYTNIELKQKLEDPLEGKKLYYWQDDIISIIKTKPDPRIIYWICEEKGNSGKTTLCKHLCQKYNSLLLSGNSNDIKCGVTNFIEKHPACKVMLFHYTKDQQHKVSYNALESIKDGIFFSGKYESGMVQYNIPHIFCFANFKPNIEKLSKDRWQIIELIGKPSAPPLSEDWLSEIESF